MKLKKKLFIFVLLLICMSFMTTAAIAGNVTERKTETIGYDFPIKPGTTEWNNMEDNLDRVAACQIPENILQNMSTKELVETVLKYPFLMDIYAYDTYEQGFKAVTEKFNGLAELSQRTDAASKLLEKYKKMEVNKIDKKNLMQIYDLSNLEILLAQDSIRNQLSNTEIDDLEKEAENKYLQKKKNPDIYGLTLTTYYKALSEKKDKTINAQAYVYTPNGTAVYVYARGEELTSSEKTAYDNWVGTTYPGATVLRTATTNYNCHSYAWYSTSTSNIYWMDWPTSYMTDGSYTYRGTADTAANDKVYYSASGKEHSGIVYSRGTGPIGPNAYNIVTVTSKWGSMGLVRHTAQNCPYYTSGLALKFYYR